MPDPARLPTSRWDRLVAVAFVAALAVPGLALIAGIRPPELENRAEAALPTLNAESLTEPGTYQAIDEYVTRNLPARDVAVDAYATLDYGLLGGSTDPDVVLGRDDWLFFVGELMPTCDVTPDALIRALDAVAAQAAVAGVQFRFGIAPDKHAIYPEPVATRTRRCRRPAQTALETRSARRWRRGPTSPLTCGVRSSPTATARWRRSTSRRIRTGRRTEPCPRSRRWSNCSRQGSGTQPRSVSTAPAATRWSWPA